METCGRDGRWAISRGSTIHHSLTKSLSKIFEGELDSYLDTSVSYRGYICVETNILPFLGFKCIDVFRPHWCWPCSQNRHGWSQTSKYYYWCAEVERCRGGSHFWWLALAGITLVIPVHMRQSQEDYESEASLDFKVSSMLGWSTRWDSVQRPRAGDDAQW